MKLISIVTPCYNEEANIHKHFERVSAAIEPLRGEYRFEHIYTDNNSEDRTFELLSEMAARNKDIKVLRFARNIGANRAIYFGLCHATGEAAILIQADLQDPPELIPEFIRGWQQGYDVVYGQIQGREEGLFMRTGRRFYYKLVAELSDVPPPENAGEFRMTSRRVLDAIREYSEDDLYLRGAIAHIGFRQKAIPYTRAGRAGGRSSVSISGLMSYAINGFLSTTVAPIRAVIIVGFITAMIGFVLTGVLVVSKLVLPEASPHGFTTLASMITFFAGTQMLAIGIIGEYIRKIYVQSLRRPKGFIQDKVNFQ